MRFLSLLALLTSCTTAAKPADPSATTAATTVPTPAPGTPTVAPPTSNADWEQPLLNQGHCTRMADDGDWEIYDVAGWRIARSVSDGSVQYSYADAGADRIATGSDDTTTTYDDRRNLVASSDSDGPTTACSFVYDSAGSRAGSSTCQSGTLSISSTYDACGQPLEVDDGTFQLTFSSTYRTGCLLADQQVHAVSNEFGAFDYTAVYDTQGRVTGDGFSLYTWHCNDGSTEASCEDGDDDQDGLADCDDPDCIDDAACSGPQAIDLEFSISFDAGPDAGLAGFSDCDASADYTLVEDPTSTCPTCDFGACGDRTNFQSGPSPCSDLPDEVCLGIELLGNGTWTLHSDESGSWEEMGTTSFSQGVHTFSISESAGPNIGEVALTWELTP